VRASAFFRGAIRRCTGRHRHENLGLILGADSCRLVLPSEGRLWEEPSLLVWRWPERRILLDGRAFGCVADQTIICRNLDRYQFVRMFESESAVDGDVLSGLLRYFRTGGARPPLRRAPDRLVLSGRPALLERIEPVLPRAASDAGFGECQTVAEHHLLTPEVGRHATALVVDVGHTATRIFAWQGGQLLAETTDAEVSGAALIQAVVDAAAREDLGIGSRTARQALAHCGNPDLMLSGRDLNSDLPRVLRCPRFVGEALAERFDRITCLCRRLMGAARSTAPARLELAGGGAVPGLALFLRQALPGIEVSLPARPGLVSARGLMRHLSVLA